MSAGAQAERRESSPLSDRDFARVRAFLKERTGIHLADAKKRLVLTRLAPRLRLTGSRSMSDYLDLVCDAHSHESEHFLNALTTNVTEFFREPYHFELLKERLFAAMWEQPARPDRIRLWSAACSTGEEPYSLAIALLESGLVSPDSDIRILATDVDSQVLARAREGTYELERARALPQATLRRYFQRGTGAREGLVRVRPAVRQLVHFARLNLFDTWPMPGPFDLIFCRNVFIYFEPAAREALIRRFHQVLGPRGYLFLGHSESMTGPVAALFQPCGHTIFQKREP